MLTALLVAPFGIFAAGYELLDADTTDQTYLHPIKVNGLWGYIDNSGKVVVKPAFEAAAHITESLAPVKISGLFGYVQPSGALLFHRSTMKPAFSTRALRLFAKARNGGTSTVKDDWSFRFASKWHVAFRMGWLG